MVPPPANWSWDGVSYTFNKKYIYITNLLGGMEVKLHGTDTRWDWAVTSTASFWFFSLERIWTNTEGKVDSEAQIIVLKMVKTHHALPKHWRVIFLRNLLNAYQAIEFCWPWISVYLSQYLTNLVHKICFTISFISCLYMFRAHVLIIRRSKLYYTASGTITPISVKHVEAWNKTYCETNFLHQVG